MKIEYHPSFNRSYKKRIAKNPKLVSQATKRIQLFEQDRTNRILKDHALTGSKKNLGAFSISGDIRIIYLLVNNNHVIFLDIGSHNQVYDK